MARAAGCVADNNDDNEEAARATGSVGGFLCREGSALYDLNTEEIIERWDRSADQYAADCSQLGDLNREVLLTPVILEILGRVVGKYILDAGCGEGFLSRLLAERGAFLTEVDYAGKLLEIARERTADELRIEYIQANLEQLDMLEENMFDIIVSCIVIQDVMDYQAALKEM